MPEERIPKLIMEWIPRERRKKRTSKENVDGRSTSSHDIKKFRNRSMEKQRGMVFGFRKTAAAVNPLNAELNPIRHLQALAGAHHFVHVSRIRVKQTG
jgi:hypothetical protein